MPAVNDEQCRSGKQDEADIYIYIYIDTLSLRPSVSGWQKADLGHYKGHGVGGDQATAPPSGGS